MRRKPTRDTNRHPASYESDPWSDPPPRQPGGYPPSGQQSPRSWPEEWPAQDWPSGDWPPEPEPYEPPPPPPPVVVRRVRRSRRRGLGCSPCLAVLFLPLVLVLAAYFLAPLRTNILLLGLDYSDPIHNVSRSDTMILTTIVPLKPYVGMLSIPRDLWVNVPGQGENRINTAHFYAEAASRGSGPQAALQTMRENFGVTVRYYVRIRFEGFRDVIDAMGGLDITLEEPAAGYPAGRHHLTGRKALAFARDRSGTDDFFRMENGQFIFKSTLKQMMNPLKWPRLPAVLVASLRSVDTNVPVWQWPRLGLALLRTGPDGIDSRTIDRDMVTGYLTENGAQVLLPNWERINPVLQEMFNQ